MHQQILSDKFDKFETIFVMWWFLNAYYLRQSSFIVSGNIIGHASTYYIHRSFSIVRYNTHKGYVNSYCIIILIDASGQYYTIPWWSKHIWSYWTHKGDSLWWKDEWQSPKSPFWSEDYCCMQSIPQVLSSITSFN